MTIGWVLLDRDGTINVKMPAPEYVVAPGQLELLPGAGDAVALLNRAGLPVAIVTNQRGVSLGALSLDDVRAVNDELVRQLARHDARVDSIHVCPHGLEQCDCRKPQPGMLIEAAAALDLELGGAVMVGDSESDVEAGIRAGTATIRLGEAGTKTQADATCPDLSAAVELILEWRQAPGAAAKPR